MNAGSESSSVSPPLDGGDARSQRIAERIVDTTLARIAAVVVEAWRLARFLLFFVYAGLAVLVFWLWVAGAILFVLRLIVATVMTVLLWLSTGVPREPGAPPERAAEALSRDLRRGWAQRDLLYAELARPLARHYVVTRGALAAFWHWSLPRKFVSLLMISAFIVIPGLYIVPRPQYVQIIDNNAIDYESVDRTRYLIHAVDLFSAGQLREYRNEDMWWLGKINSQRMKNRLQHGRFFKVWIVGIRWWKFPVLYPNIIGATETDADGRALEEPSQFIPPTTTGH